MRVSYLFAGLLFGSSVAAAELPTVERYKVMNEGGEQELRGVGSGLTFLERRGDSLVFLMNTDRGPNVPGPRILRDGEEQESVVFTSPDFSPLFAEVVVGKGGAVIKKTTSLRTKEGRPLLGTPPKDFDAQYPLTPELDELPIDQEGYDIEGITVGDKGEVWLCDEYGPSILRVKQESGTVVASHSPNNKLPALFKFRQANRGFEAIVRLSDGSILAPLQSTLDFGGDSKKRGNVIPVLHFNPTSESSLVLGYPIERGDGAHHKVKLGDITRLSDSSFIVIQSGELHDKDYARLYRIEISEAEDLTRELGKGREVVSGKRLIKKTLLLDLAEVGWSHEKTEGVTILPDGKTLALSNDNDFGVTSSFRVDPTKVTMTEKGKLVGKVKKKDFVVEAKGEAISEVWLLRFPEKLI